MSRSLSAASAVTGVGSMARPNRLLPRRTCSRTARQALGLQQATSPAPSGGPSGQDHSAITPAAGWQDGETVLGRVVWSGPKGANILLLDHPGVTGYMPSREAPFALRDAMEENPWSGAAQGPGLAPGVVREFRVLGMAANGSAGSRQHGPLVSARLLDLDRLWQRTSQLLMICSEAKENLQITVEAANSGGLISKLNGLSLFIPVSQLEKRPDGAWWTEQDMAEHFTGQKAFVAVVEVVRTSRKVVCSIARARENDELRRLGVGSLVQGTVRRVEPFGAFVGIHGTRVSGLLHISNVSRQHIETMQGVFTVGEKVQCVVMGLDPSYQNISLSTAELELSDGDILHDRAAVWSSAEEQAQLFQAHLAALGNSGFDFDDYAHNQVDGH